MNLFIDTADIAQTDRPEAGGSGLNDGVPPTSQCPFGDVKRRDWGRELGTEGFDAFPEIKQVSIPL